MELDEAVETVRYSLKFHTFGPEVFVSSGEAVNLVANSPTWCMLPSDRGDLVPRAWMQFWLRDAEQRLAAMALERLTT